MDRDRIIQKLDRIDEKLDQFMVQQAKNTLNIAWIKRIGVSLVAVLGFLMSQIYMDLKNQPPIIKNEHIYNKKGMIEHLDTFHKGD